MIDCATITLMGTQELFQFFERLQKFRLLEPDAELASCGHTAVQFMEERVDEFAQALSSFGIDHVPTLRIERDVLAAASSQHTLQKQLGSPFLCAPLARASVRVDEAFQQLPTSARAQLDALAYLARWTEQRSSTWTRRVASTFPPNTVPPWERVLQWHARWLLVYGDASETPSPWWPLYLLWERGAWPCMGEENTLIVYVPVFAGGELQPTPEHSTVPIFDSTYAYVDDPMGLSAPAVSLGMQLQPTTPPPQFDALSAVTAYGIPPMLDEAPPDPPTTVPQEGWMDRIRKWFKA